jgi:hypothetical protein
MAAIRTPPQKSTEGGSVSTPNGSFAATIAEQRNEGDLP